MHKLMYYKNGAWIIIYWARNMNQKVIRNFSFLIEKLQITLNVFAIFSVLTTNCESLFKWIASCDSQIVRIGAHYCIKLL